MTIKRTIISLPEKVVKTLDYMVEKRLAESRTRIINDGIVLYLTMLESVLEAFIELKREGYEDPQGTPKLVARALDKATDLSSEKLLGSVFSFVGKIYSLSDKEQEELLEHLKEALR